MRFVVFVLLALLAIAHQDFWWRSDHRTLVLGFLPVSLAYHVGISVAATVLWGLACAFCWPRELESDQPFASRRESGDPR
ncbi:MAG: hypothetical protein HRF50_07530 [Phycisphaerae bacterium]|jgi:hypothetical protein